MMPFKVTVTAIATLGLLFLSACSSSNQASNPTNSPAATPAETQPAATTAPAISGDKAASKKADNHGGQGGQVIESGSYHLELVTEKEADATHIDFFLQKGDNHEAVSNAKVTAQVQLPNGSQKSVAMKYDTQDQHYTGILPGTAAGEHKVAILSDIGGEKVNGRFSFTR